MQSDKVNILLVDDQPAKLLSYEVILRELGENLIKSSSASDALEQLLRNEVAVVLVDVCMPDLDGFELAKMIREHPRFQRTAIIFVSAIHLTDIDCLRGYEMGAVDYVPVPVVPAVLRAKVKVFAELYRKTRQLERLNEELESRVAERTRELQASTGSLLESERRRTLALAAGQMGSWEWDVATGECVWDAGQYRIFDVDPENFSPTLESMRSFIHPEDLQRVQDLFNAAPGGRQTFQMELRIVRPSGETRWCICAAALTVDAHDNVGRVSGVTIDITDRKLAEERQLLLAREVDHRARNTLAIVQAIVRLTRAHTIPAYGAAVEGRIRALAHAHTLLSESRWKGAEIERLVTEELAPYQATDGVKLKIEGPRALLPPDKAQTMALALHELATNAAKYGPISSGSGEIRVEWELAQGCLRLCWTETGGPPVKPPHVQGFGMKIMTASIRHQIGGHVYMSWNPTGLCCTLSIPCTPDAAAGAVSDKETSSNLVELPSSSSKRVLLAEDEALVGMGMRDLLSDLGLFVVGPFCSVAEALGALAKQKFDCAVLDINLGSELVYPVAAALARERIPFIFATGYGSESLDRRFSDVPVVQKPVALEKLEEVLRPWVRPVPRNSAGYAWSGAHEMESA